MIPQLSRSKYCLDCGHQLVDKYCSKCGQKIVQRIDFDYFLKETLVLVDFFEHSLYKKGVRVLKFPGTVAREYLSGRRTTNPPVFKYLLIFIALLLYLLNKQHFVNQHNSTIQKLLNSSFAYGNFTLSIGIFAIVLSNTIIFRKAKNLNFVEHFVVAAYIHTVVIFFNILKNLPFFIESFRVSIQQAGNVFSYAIEVIECGIVVSGILQFYELNLKQHWLKLMLYAIIYATLKKALVIVYASIVFFVFR